MIEHPILFNTEMVNAILEGRKTMTRRVIKSQPSDVGAVKIHREQMRENEFYFSSNTGKIGIFTPQFVKCPYGPIGSKLWVKETWAASRLFDLMPPRDIPQNADLFFKADGIGNWNNCARVRPSIFMPRWASRVALEITNIRVEQVQDITDSDAIQEGVDRTNTSIPGYAVQRFKALWDSINKKRGYGWDKNPWVWGVEFRRVE